MENKLDDIIKEIIHICSTMSEPERSEYLAKHFSITRKEKVIKTRLMRDPKIPGAYREYNVEEDPE